jgi:hypothetical protein
MCMHVFDDDEDDLTAAIVVVAIIFSIAVIGVNCTEFALEGYDCA